MKKYDVVIKATITKIIKVQAENEDSAIYKAYEVFNPDANGSTEKYEQDIVSIKENRS